MPTRKPGGQSRLPGLVWLACTAPQLGVVMGEVGALLAPLEEACGAEVARLEAQAARHAALTDALDELGRRIANMD